MKRYFVLFFTLSCFSQAAWSFATVTVTNQSKIDISGTYSWPSQPKDGVVICTSVRCSVVVCAYDRSEGICTGGNNNPVYTVNGDTAYEAWQKFTNNGARPNGRWSAIFPSYVDPSKYCGGLAVLRASNNGPATLIAGSGCGVIPGSGALECSIQETLKIEHGTLEPNRVNGNRAQKTVTINCNKKATLSLKLLGSDKIELGNDGLVTSTLFANNSNLATGLNITLPDGNTKIDIVSVLSASTSNVPAGARQGNGVVVIDFK